MAILVVTPLLTDERTMRESSGSRHGALYEAGAAYQSGDYQGHPQRSPTKLAHKCRPCHRDSRRAPLLCEPLQRGAESGVVMTGPATPPAQIEARQTHEPR